MIVEHAFVTTLDALDALGSARDLLLSRGWNVTLQSQDAIEATRGQKYPGRAKSIHTLPQSIRVEYDRGRVTVGVSILPARKDTPQHSAYLLAIVQAIESHLVDGDPQCCIQWDQLIAHHDAELARRKRRERIVLVCAIILIVLVPLSLIFLFISTITGR